MCPLCIWSWFSGLSIIWQLWSGAHPFLYNLSAQGRFEWQRIRVVPCMELGETVKDPIGTVAWSSSLTSRSTCSRGPFPLNNSISEVTSISSSMKWRGQHRLKSYIFRHRFTEAIDRVAWSALLKMTRLLVWFLYLRSNGRVFGSWRMEIIVYKY